MRAATLFASIFLVVHVSASDWSYSGDDGPDTWSTNFPTCGGQSQSPIDIDPYATVPPMPKGRCPKPLKPLKFKKYGKELSGTLINNGHAVQFNPDDSSSQILSGGTLRKGEKYQFSQLHFHWGSDSSVGSEHTVNGVHFPLEMHMVHTNVKYLDNSTEALQNSDGLAVVGVFFTESSSEDFEPFNEVANGAFALLGDDRYAGADEAIVSLRLNDFLDAIDTDHYWSYQGSLTTPTCNQVVSWIVMEDPIALSPSQMDSLRLQLTENGEPLTDNFRPTQPLNGRKVTKVGEDEDDFY